MTKTNSKQSELWTFANSPRLIKTQAWARTIVEKTWERSLINIDFKELK